ESMTLEMKMARLADLQQTYQKEIAPQITTPGLKRAFDGPLNNARLLAMRTYFADFDDFEQLYLLSGRSFTALLKECMDLRDSKNPEQELKDRVAAMAGEKA